MSPSFHFKVYGAKDQPLHRIFKACFEHSGYLIDIYSLTDFHQNIILSTLKNWVRESSLRHVSGLPGALRPGVAFPAKGPSLQAGHTHTTPEMPSRAALALNRTGREGKGKVLPSTNEMCGLCVTLPEINPSVSAGTLGLPRKQCALSELTEL